MKKCTCKADYNITEADIQIRSPHDISIKIDRAPDPLNPTIQSLQKRIEDLEVFNLHIDDEIERALGEKLQQLDIVTLSALNEMLSIYSTKEDLLLLKNNLMGIILAEREINDSRYLQKAYVTQNQYDTMDKKENTIYVIREN